MIDMTKIATVFVAASMTFAIFATPRDAAAYPSQVIYDFSNDVGVTTITDDFWGNQITGGVVRLASTAFPAVALGSNVYVATGSGPTFTISTAANGEVTLWPVIGAYVTPGGAPVTATFYGGLPFDYQNYFGPENFSEIGTAVTSGNAPNQYLSFLNSSQWDPNDQTPLEVVTFSSSEPFAIANLTFGLPDVPVGIPEPSTWAMMLVGFAGIGMAGHGLKRRRGALASAA
jgi:hypothetical protein